MAATNMNEPKRERGKAEGTPKKRRLTLAGQVLLGLGLGVAVGAFFGDMVGWLGVVGDVFIRLLQITVIPYISVSLIIGLGSLEHGEIRKLAIKGGAVILVIWAITLCVIYLMPVAFPNWLSASFFSTSQVEDPKPPDFLRLFIPSNPFFSYANALVPAVVVFSVLIGVGLACMAEKEAVLHPLSVARDTLMWVTSGVSKLAPYGVFALIATAAGTTEIPDLLRMQVYLVLYALTALFLSLWVLPALVACSTPLRHGDILRALRTPLITAFATGSSLIVLPLLIEQCKCMVEERKLFGEEDQEQFEASVKTLIPTSFTFPSPSALLALSFVLFAGWFSGSPVSVDGYPGLVFAGIPALFGGVTLAVPFLLDLVGLPSDLFQVFLSADVINSRFGTLLSAMHYAAVGLLGAFALAGRLRLRWGALMRLLAISAAIIVPAFVGVRIFYTHVVVAPYTRADALRRLHLVSDPQPCTVYDEESSPIPWAGQGPASLAEIKARGVLRVGYTPGNYPSAFLNAAEPPQLVGFDIEMAHLFARRLELPIEFLPVLDQAQASERLDAGDIDVVMTSMPVSLTTSERFAMSVPIYESPVGVVVRDPQRDGFRTWSDARRRGAIRVAVPAGPDSIALARTLLPEATFVPFVPAREIEEIFRSGARGLDAVVHSSEHGAAWTLLFPEFSLVVPRPVASQPLGYAVARGNDGLLTPLNAWLGERKATGRVNALYSRWMLGRVSTAEKPPRWSIIRDVLGWVD